jgi:hypothetical protein
LARSVAPPVSRERRARILLLVDQRTRHRDRCVVQEGDHQLRCVRRPDQPPPRHPRLRFGEPTFALAELACLYLPLAGRVGPSEIDAVHPDALEPVRAGGILGEQGRGRLAPYTARSGVAPCAFTERILTIAPGAWRSPRWRTTPFIRNMGARVFIAKRRSKKTTSESATTRGHSTLWHSPASGSVRMPRGPPRRYGTARRARPDRPR